MASIFFKLKNVSSGEVRLATITPDDGGMFCALQHTAREIFHVPEGLPLRICALDADGDLITLATAHEVQEMVAKQVSLGRQTALLLVDFPEPAPAPAQAASAGPSHAQDHHTQDHHAHDHHDHGKHGHHGRHSEHGHHGEHGHQRGGGLGGQHKWEGKWEGCHKWAHPGHPAMWHLLARKVWEHKKARGNHACGGAWW